MIRVYKYQLKPNASQRRFFAQAFGSARFIYNWALSERIRIHAQENRVVTGTELCAMLTKLKATPEKKWLYDSPNVCLQQSIRHMDAAFSRFFKEKKGFPKFKQKKRTQAIRFTEAVKVDFLTSKIRLPKIGWVPFFSSRVFDGRTASATVTMNAAGKYFVSVVVHTGHPTPTNAPVDESTTIGIDVGLKEFAVMSNGDRIQNPKHYQKEEKKLLVLNVRHKRKQKGSKRREAARLKLAKFHYRNTCKRKDFIHKLTSRIVAENQSIVIEDLNLLGMVKNRNLSKGIFSASWGEFFRQLEYKCKWSGKNLIRIGRFEPSSRMCTCGLVNKSLTLKDRAWKCPSCGAEHDRDLLAAQNIKRFGLRIAAEELKHTGEALAGEDVETPAVKGSMKRQRAVSHESQWLIDASKNKMHLN